MSKSIKSRLENSPSALLNNYCSSLRLQAYHKGELALDLAFGRPYKYYDLASLTKILVTTSLYIDIAGQQPSFLNEKFFGYRVRDLLGHKAGFKAWVAMYEKLNFRGNWRQRRSQMALYFEEHHHQFLKKDREELYSDIDFIFLGLIVEFVRHQSLNKLWEDYAKKHKLKTLHFNPDNKPKYKRADYAPTYSHQWRPQKVQGVVNDANCRAMGGVSGHAGLFGSIDDVSAWGMQLRQCFMGEWGLHHPDVVKRFTRARKGDDFALGFMRVTPGASSAGQYFSSRSIGHLGFTGTSLWYDPQRDLLVTILSNRNIPDKKGYVFKKLRPLLHDLVVKTI